MTTTTKQAPAETKAPEPTAEKSTKDSGKVKYGAGMMRY
jgi:hypothetical protein